FVAHGALIGFVGATGLQAKNFGTPSHGGTIAQNDHRYLKIGSSFTLSLPSQDTGRLYLGFNDDYGSIGQAPPPPYDVTLDNSGTVTATISVCGNGVTEAGEQCDSGSSNGSAISCCTSSCTFKTSASTCRPAAGACDIAETCTGSSGVCPANT